MRPELPTGTVTFLFTDIEGSTRLLREMGDGYADVLAEHRRALREAWRRHHGVEVDTQGDAFFVAFARASDAVAAAADAQRVLEAAPVRVRMGLHTGEPVVDVEGYVGLDVHRAARIAAAGHGGQVLVSATTHELVADEVLDLGRHRLKDFAEPVALFQLGFERFPPLRTISNTNLPVLLSSFVGREREEAEVVSLIRDEAARLVTLTGPGGTGKTRLAVAVAGELVSEFGAGIFWIGLSAVRDPALVVELIAQTLEARQEVAVHIGDKHLLLVLDNLEQVIGSAVDLTALLQACPNLCMLTTSREVLRVDGEVVYPVPALADPEAVELFCARAGVEPDETVAELCVRLDNLPLALELAAARISVLTPAQILERISQRLDLFRGGRGADPRQETLRTTIEWSYELLNDKEKALFARLAVFRGGCTIEAAEQVADADLDTLQSLVDKSLLRHSAGRFRMLQTVREYARELLATMAEGDAVRRRHAEHYLSLADAAYAARSDPDPTVPRRLDEEHDNLRAALDYLHEHSATEYLQLAGALGWFWGSSGRLGEASRHLEDALACPSENERLTARALRSLAVCNSLAGRYAAALSQLEQAIDLWRGTGDESEVMKTRDDFGMVLYRSGDTERALQIYEQNLELARSSGQQALVTASLGGVCQLLLATGEFERAEPLAQELGVDHYLADCAMHRKDYTLARRHYSRQLEAWLLAGDEISQSYDMLGLAMAMAGLGRDESALRLEAAIDAEWDELELVARPRVLETWRARDLGAARARVGEQQATALIQRGRAMTWEQAVELALDESHD